MNTNGGSLSRRRRGALLREAVLQLRGQAGERQVAGAQVALVTPGGYYFNSQGVLLRAG